MLTLANLSDYTLTATLGHNGYLSLGQPFTTLFVSAGKCSPTHSHHMTVMTYSNLWMEG